MPVWAVNQIARRTPQDARALVDAGEKLRKAQRAAVSGRDPDVLREAQHSHRERLDELTAFGRRELELSGPNVQRVAQLLRAASVDKDASKSLLAGTLAGDVEDTGFGPLLTLVPPGGGRASPRRTKAREDRQKPKAQAKAVPKPPPKPKRDPHAARRKRLQDQLEKARGRVRELEAQLQELGE